MSSNQPLRRPQNPRRTKISIRTPEYMAAIAAAEESSDTDSSSSVETVDLIIPRRPVQVIESSSSSEEDEDDESEKGSTMSWGDSGVADWVNCWGDGVEDCFGDLTAEGSSGGVEEDLCSEGQDTLVLDGLSETTEEMSPMSPSTSIDETTCDGIGVNAGEGEGVDNELGEGGNPEPEKEGPTEPEEEGLTEPEEEGSTEPKGERSPEPEPQPPRTQKTNAPFSVDQLREIKEYLANRGHFSGGAIDKIPKPGTSNPNGPLPLKISFGKPTQSHLPSKCEGDPRFANRIVGPTEYFNLPDEDKGPAMKESAKFMRRIMDEVDAKMEEEEKEKMREMEEMKAAEVERKRLAKENALFQLMQDGIQRKTRMSSGSIQRTDYSVLFGVGLGMKSNKESDDAEGEHPREDPTPTRPSTTTATGPPTPQRREKRKLSAKSEPILESAPVRGAHGYTPPVTVHTPTRPPIPRPPIQGPGHQGGDNWLIDKIVASKIVTNTDGVKILYKVKWKYWGKIFNEWINQNDFENFSVDTYWKQTLRQINDLNAVIEDVAEEVEGHGTYMFW